MDSFNPSLSEPPIKVLVVNAPDTSNFDKIISTPLEYWYPHILAKVPAHPPLNV